MTPEPTREAVNRAGRLVAELLAAYRTDDDETLERLEGNELERLEAAVETIEWWRSLHAKPLTSLSANLRHYLKEQGPVAVTQRLKRAPTMIDKLLRAAYAGTGTSRALEITQPHQRTPATAPST